MLIRITASLVLLFTLAGPLSAQEDAATNPAESQLPELDVLKGAIGVWDANIEVWANGPDGDVITFKGVETNRAYGDHWIASDFVSEFGGQTMKLHSIVGYDLSKKQLVGLVIDNGPYSARMTGKYDEKTRTVEWKTEAKAADGTPMVQKTLVTQKSDEERILTLMVPGTATDDFRKFMQITFTKRK